MATISCPKSIRACAIRLTRLAASGVPLDPLVPNSRIQTAGFAELTLTPDIEVGPENIIKVPSGHDVAITDKQCDILKGMTLSLKLCGVPLAVLEMLCGVNLLTSGADVVGGAIRGRQDTGDGGPVMVEVWSKNASPVCDPSGVITSNLWIQWVLPKTYRWHISGGLTFSSGPLEVTLEGYGQQNPVWSPCYPGTTFPSYVPGGGNPAGLPSGAAGPVIPSGVLVDPWSLADQAVIRDSGPLAWKSVNSLPYPLLECKYAPSAA